MVGDELTNLSTKVNSG